MGSLGTLTLDMVAKTSSFTWAIGRSKKSLGSVGSSMQKVRRDSLIMGKAMNRAEDQFDSLVRGIKKAEMRLGRLRVALRKAGGGDFRFLSRIMSGTFASALKLGGSLFLDLAASAAKAGAAITAIGVGGFVAFSVSSVKAAADMEKTRVSFRTLLGDVEKGDKLLSELFDFSKKTPFTPDQLFKTGKTLLTGGFGADQITDVIQDIGDVAAVSGSEISDLAFILSQVANKGKADTQDLYQIAERGIPIFRELEKVVNADGAALRKMVEGGEVGIDQVLKAFRNMTSESGAFFRGMEKQSKTLSGIWSTLVGNFHAGKVTFGEAFAEGSHLKIVMQDLNTLVSEFDWRAFGESAVGVFRVMAKALDPLFQMMILGRQHLLGFEMMGVLRELKTAETAYRRDPTEENRLKQKRLRSRLLDLGDEKGSIRRMQKSMEKLLSGEGLFKDVADRGRQQQRRDDEGRLWMETLMEVREENNQVAPKVDVTNAKIDQLRSSIEVGFAGLADEIRKQQKLGLAPAT